MERRRGRPHGTKLVVGDGPDLPRLRRLFPETVFVGTKRGEDLARHYAASDAFVFPSRTDTFGLVVLEALASGLPVAAYPVTGPLELIGQSGAGRLSPDLRRLDPGGPDDPAGTPSGFRSLIVASQAGRSP